MWQTHIDKAMGHCLMTADSLRYVGWRRRTLGCQKLVPSLGTSRM